MHLLHKFRFIDFILISIFYFFSNYLYFAVNPIVNYMYKMDILFSIKFTIINYLFLVFIIIILPIGNILERNIFLVLIFSVLIPSFIISNHTSKGLWINFILFISFVLIFIWYYIFSKLKISFAIKGFSVSNSLFYKFNFILGLVFFLIFILPKINNLSDFNILNTFENVYKIREDNKLSGLDAYLLNWTISLIIPILISDFFTNRSFKSIVLAFLLILTLFQFYAMKAHFFSFFLLLFFGFFLKNYFMISRYIVYIFYFIIFLITILAGNLGFAFLDRFFYGIGLLNQNYFDFFNNHPYNFFYGSKLGFLTSHPNYNKGVGFIVDDYYFASGGSNASTGFLAAIFSEIGYFGLFFGILLTSLIITILKSLYRKSKELGYIIGIQMTFFIMNTPLNDMFLSYGFIFVIFILFFLKKNGMNYSEKLIN